VKGGKAMIMLGIDAHKRTHTVVAVDELGRRLASKTTTATTTKDHLELIQWADQFGTDRTWAVEDCRHLSRRLERRHARRRGTPGPSATQDDGALS
jgi:transposase